MNMNTFNLTTPLGEMLNITGNWFKHVKLVMSANLIICLVGTLTNTTALLVFSKPRHQSTMRSMLFYLSLAEVILEVIAGISVTFNLISYWNSNFLENRVVMIIQFIFSDAHITAMTVRNFWVAIIALKRWDATSRPLRPRFQKVSKARLGQLFILFYVTFPLVFIPLYTMVPSDDPCSQIRFYFYYLVISNGLTFTIIATSGVLTIFKSGKVSRYVTTVRPSLQRRQRAVTRTILTLLFTFLICEVSFLCIYILHYSDYCLETDYGIARNPFTILIAYMLTDVDSICNFFIYFFCYSPFKRRLIALFRRNWTSVISTQSGPNPVVHADNSVNQNPITDTCL